jgi:CRP-like cAMP-binding protein
MQRKVVLAKGASLWEAGDPARTLGVLESGRLGIRTARGLVGVASPKSVVGEGSLLALLGVDQPRSATLYALTDDTTVTEYPAAAVKQLIEGGNDVVASLVLGTLASQACRNLLIVASAHKGRHAIELPLRGLLQGLIQASRQLKGTIFWDEFLTSFSFLHELRDYSGLLRDRLPPESGSSIEDSVEASELVQALVDPKAVADIESLLAQERESEALLKTHGA